VVTWYEYRWTFQPVVACLMAHIFDKLVRAPNVRTAAFCLQPTPERLRNDAFE
jgi:hypothetical protein